MRAIQIVLVFSVILAVSNSASAEDNTQKTSGLANRTPLTTSNVRGRPEPPLPFRAEVAFPKINFKNPTVLTNAPGTDRFFVAEQSGKIYSIVGNRSSSKKDLFVDVARLVEQLNGTLDDADKVQGSTTYGLTFHPQVAENNYCYICYVGKEQVEELGLGEGSGTTTTRGTPGAWAGVWRDGMGARRGGEPGAPRAAVRRHRRHRPDRPPADLPRAGR